MTRTIVTRTIDAPRELVFRAVSDLDILTEVAPNVIGIDVLSRPDAGGPVGTRFKETRLMMGKENQTELEITEFVDGERVRMVSDSHGTVWDTVFTVRDIQGGTELNLTMDAKARGFMPMLMNPLFKTMIKKGLDEHVDHVKAFCERGGR